VYGRQKLWARRQLHPIILSFLDEEQDNQNHPLYGEVRIEIFTEYKRNGVTYHACPNYNSFGEWYDWAMVKFELENDITNLQEEDEGYYGKNLFPAKYSVSYMLRMTQFMLSFIAAIQIITVKTVILWNIGKRNLKWRTTCLCLY